MLYGFSDSCNCKFHCGFHFFLSEVFGEKVNSLKVLSITKSVYKFNLELCDHTRANARKRFKRFARPYVRQRVD